VTSFLERAARRIFLSDAAQAIYEPYERVRQRVALRLRRKGSDRPPPHLLKQRTVKEYARRFSIGTLVETGTYLGAMINATKDTFSRIYSIELDPALFQRAKRKYARFEHISLIHGDSSEVLPTILADLRQPCLFWLDAHYSGGFSAKGTLESPILQEVRHILNHPIDGHVILIDDAHEFKGRGGYPTLTELQDMIHSKHPGWIFQVKDDIIRVHRPAHQGHRRGPSSAESRRRKPRGQPWASATRLRARAPVAAGH